MVNTLKERRLKMLLFVYDVQFVTYFSKQVTFSQCDIKNSESCADSGIPLVLL